MSVEAWLVVVAAGKGERLGAGQPKAFVLLAGYPLIAYSLEAAASSPSVAAAVVVGDHPAYRQIRDLMPSRARALVDAVVPGGASRAESVRAGLEFVRENSGGDPVVLVHDAARPFAPPELFTAVAEAAAEGAAIPVRAAVETVKRLDGARIAATVDRADLGYAQTPQGAPLSLLMRAHAEGGDAPDDAALIEALGEPVRTVPADAFNLKITTPEDLRLAEAWVAAGGTPWMTEE